MELLEEIKDAWDNNKLILVYDSDDREAEIDFVIPSVKVLPKHIAEMRDHAGGLICCSITEEIANKIELPWLYELYRDIGGKYEAIDRMSAHNLPYGAKSSFSVSINHVDCFTGITDKERALTVNQVGKIISQFENEEFDEDTLCNKFGNNFRIPGHVPLLIAQKGLLDERQGHTELGLALCQLLGFSSSTTICEMMSSETNKATNLDEAREYAEKNGYPFVDGKTIIDLWKRR